MDRLITSGTIKPMIAVLPDCFTRYGGSQYLNSTATGNYEDYVVHEIVSYVDENFRTVKSASARALMGKSSGGYGAMVLSMKHPEVFGLAASIAGDAYFDFCYKPDIPKAFRAIKGNVKKHLEKIYDEEAKTTRSDFDGFNIIGMSACYSPNPASEIGFDLPFDDETGALNESVWQRWLANDPVYLAEKYAENLKKLNLFFLDAGTSDEFALDIGARVLAKKLTQLGVPHEKDEFDGGHFGASYRYNRSLALISDRFGT